MKNNRYEITVRKLENADDVLRLPNPLVFEVSNHDEILGVVERLKQRGDFSEEQATALGVGLKLFGEVMLENRQHPLFKEIFPAFGEFMKSLKRGTA